MPVAVPTIGGTALTEDVDELTKDATKEDILAPRFYTTDFKKMNNFRMGRRQADFEQMLTVFKEDRNKGHFVRTEDFKGPFKELPRDHFAKFCTRSAMGEFSGALLYQEMVKKVEDPTIREIYKCLARDEGRHASMLTHSLKDLGVTFDLSFLTKAKKRTMITPKIMFITVYLSEIIGYYRYITIYNHLEAHPEFLIHPIFLWFGRWCEDEHRHGRFFALQMQAEHEQCIDGFVNKALIRFFTLAVYMTMFLRDDREPAIYNALGLDAREYDLEVLKVCDEEARTTWGFGFDVTNPKFVAALDSMAVTNRKLSDVKPGRLARLRKLPYYVKNVRDIARLFLLKTIPYTGPQLEPLT